MVFSGLLVAGALVAQPCLANPDTVRALRQQVTQTFAFLDTLRLQELGLPPRVASIALVSDSTVCARALDELYAYDSRQGTKKAAGAYVFGLDSTAYVVTPADDVHTFTYYDRSWHWLAGLGALD